METIEILEGNKLIAEFMGYEKYTIKGKSDGYRIVKINTGITFDSCVGSLEFHSSWDWLMPVVEKIELSGYVVNIKGISVSISRLLADDSIVQYVCGNLSKKIELVYITVIEFIKWYNSQNNN